MMKANLYFNFSLIVFCIFTELSAQAKPNFIIILTDDQGYNDLGCYGSTNIKTPNIDQLAAEGRKFTSFYSASSVCTPSRAALLTGCYPKRINMGTVLFPYSQSGLNPNEVTIADLLKTAHYATACIGKWHLGHGQEFLPTKQGFDSFYGIPYSNDMKHPDDKNKPWAKWDQTWSQPEEMLKKWNTPLMENETIIELPCDQRTITRRYTDKAIDFVETHQDQPFFLYLPHSMPHVPLFVPDDVHDPNIKTAYKTVIEHLDTEVGRLIDTVKKLGLSKKTYIIFTSDNGPWTKWGPHGGSAKPLRGAKAQTYEGGQRVPCIMWGPGRIPAGSVSRAITTTMDLFPTIAKLVGIEAKTLGPIDGKDISSVILTNSPSPRKELLYYSLSTKLEGIRQGDWKLRTAEGATELFNLEKDIGETNNLAKMMPEKVISLKKRMTHLDEEISKNCR